MVFKYIDMGEIYRRNKNCKGCYKVRCSMTIKKGLDENYVGKIMAYIIKRKN